MSKKYRFWRPLDEQHVKGPQTLLKSEEQNLKHIYWWLWRQLSWKKYLLVICKVLRLFVNALTADDKYSILKRDNFMQPTQRQLSLRKILNIFKKKMTLISDVFPKLRTPKNVVK